MKTISTAATKNTGRFVHIMDDAEDWAIQSSLAANRPLLVRGEPGIGKTQLAHAAAVDLNRPLVSLTVDSNTESRELMWTFDAVQRLAEAQVVSNFIKNEQELEERIHVRNFIRPGPLWWAYDWESAEKQLSTGDRTPQIPKGWG
jgi:MoxR-like ATPase